MLEIGTGTGYNAALLAHRLGPDQVTSIEIDANVAAQARRALSDTGYSKVCTITGDGAHGHPAGAPYHRIIATAAVHRLPSAWVAQTRPGGRILLPWANDYTGMLVALTVDEHGNASGGIVGDSSFMWLREQRVRRGPVGDLDFQSRSWTKLIHTTPDASDDEFPVYQHGPRRLWDEVATARQWWVDQGRPSVERWRFTVTPEDQNIDLI